MTWRGGGVARACRVDELLFSLSAGGNHSAPMHFSVVVPCLDETDVVVRCWDETVAT